MVYRTSLRFVFIPFFADYAIKNAIKSVIMSNLIYLGSLLHKSTFCYLIKKPYKRTPHSPS